MPRKTSSATLALLLLVSAAAAAETKINGVVYGKNGQAIKAHPVDSKKELSPELALRIKKIFLFPSIDDLSGALAPKLDDKVAALFSRNTRFELIRDPQVIKALSPDEATYYKVAQNQNVHQEAARVTGADTTVLLRTHNLGPNTQMTLELRDANGNLILAEQGAVPGSAPMDTRNGMIEQLFATIVAKIPYEGTITGRTATTLTVDLGIGVVRQGEEFEAAKIVAVQRHPLLGTVVGTDLERTGRARITSVDKVLSFAEVLEEVPGQKISPGQKVLLKRRNTVHRGSEESEKADAAVQKKSTSPRFNAPEKKEDKEENPLDDRLQGDFDRPKQRFGQAGASLYYGSLSHSQSVGSTNSDYAGTGIGGDLNGELWVTKNWIVSALYGFQNATLTGQGATVGETSWNQFLFTAGYRVFPDSIAEGLSLTGSIGFENMKFGLPSDARLNVSGRKYSGIVLMAASDIAFLQNQKISAGFTIMPFGSMEETGVSLGSPSSASVIGIHLGWNRELADAFWLRVGMRYDIANGSYENSSNTVSNKRFAIGPGIYYQF